MNKAEFIGWLQHPENLNSETISGLKALREEFPYCASVRTLLTLNYFMTQSVHYEKELRSTAVYTNDRGILKKQIDRVRWSMQPVLLPDEAVMEKSAASEANEHSATVTPNVENVQHAEVPVADANPEKAGPAASSESKLKDAHAEIDAIRDIVNRHLEELHEENDRQQQKERVEQKVVKTEKKRTPKRSKSDIIDTFIKNQPSISRPKASFYDPVEVAKESIVDQENIISETLATIYFDQGHLEKAIKIYQKLSLKYPEKSSYFAALIEKAEKELNS